VCDEWATVQAAARHICCVTKSRAKELSFWTVNSIGWFAFAVSMSLSRIGRFPIGYMLASKYVMGVLGLAISGFILRPLYKRTLGADASLARMILVTATASYFAAALWTAAHSLIDLQLVRALVDPNAFYRSLWQVFGGTLYDAFAMLSWSVLYVGIKHQRALHLERERALRAESFAQQARLDALRWQLNPHFLFNALNAISTLVIDERGREARAMIARLGDLLRSTLELPGSAEIPLGDEIQLVQRYLEIEQVRLGDRLQVEVKVEEGCWRALVPPMLLQPIVENAIRHAIAPRNEPGCIRVGATLSGAQLMMTVEDDGPGMPTSHLPASGIGLANTRERLAHMYPGVNSLTLGRSTAGGVLVTISIPFRER
jgi:two-component system LytT family sensor kinase